MMEKKSEAPGAPAISAVAASAVPMLYWLFQRIDEQRRWQAQLLDLLGGGPREQPGRALLQVAAMHVKAYGASAGPAILLVPAPIKRACIWDLAPGASVVEQLLGGSIRPYLLQWQEPDPASGLEAYLQWLALAVQAIRAECGEERIFVAGHSLGGLFAAIFACLHPAQVRGLVTIGAPMHFALDATAGALGPVVARIAEGELLAALPGNLPGSLLSAASHAAAPVAFGEDRQRDWLASLGDADARATHQRVERWCLDELPLARALVIDLVRRIYSEDAFLRGTLRIGGEAVTPARLLAPWFVVADRRCRVVPPAAILPFYAAAASADKQLHWYAGDVGVGIQHVGPLVGRKALQHLWPAIMRWMRAR